MKIKKIADSEIQKRGGMANILNKYGLLKSIDLVMKFFLAYLIENFYSPKSLKFGLTEALLFARPPYSIDWYCRNSTVAREIQKLAPKRVLDVGGGRNGIFKFINKNSEVFIVDIRKGAFLGKNRKDFSPIVADACHLPFKEQIFDVSCGVSMLEHIPLNHRVKAMQELKRVGNVMIVHLPVDSNNCSYVGGRADSEFLRIHEDFFGFIEETTAEHVTAKHITIEELKHDFPDAIFEGRTNYYIWLKYMLLSRLPFCYFTGLFYLFVWKAKDNKSPYYEVMIVMKNA